MHWNIQIRERPVALAAISDNDNVDRAIVFVHGFSGDPDKTWRDFCLLLSLHEEKFSWYSRADLYFYGYSNFRKTVAYNSQESFRFIRQIFPRPNVDVFELVPRDELGWISRELRGGVEAVLASRKYSRLILVGHSEGGLLLRLGIWEALKTIITESPEFLSPTGDISKACDEIVGRDVILGSDLCLFSPAHIGVRGPISNFAKQVARIPIVGDALVSILSLPYPCVTTMAKGDDILEDVKDYTTESWEKYRYISTLSARVLWGGNEALLDAWNYKWDSPVEHQDGVGHIRVCKPTVTYDKPLTFVCYERRPTISTT